eukprot:COSAG04_NODE_19645_length_411_cov_0.743590_2_plen_37_part_01
MIEVNVDSSIVNGSSSWNDDDALRGDEELTAVWSASG